MEKQTNIENQKSIAFEIISNILIDIFKIERNEIKHDSRLSKDLGLDSLDITELQIEIDKAIKHPIDTNDYSSFDWKTINDAIEYTIKYQTK